MATFSQVYNSSLVLGSMTILVPFTFNILPQLFIIVMVYFAIEKHVDEDTFRGGGVCKSILILKC